MKKASITPCMPGLKKRKSKAEILSHDQMAALADMIAIRMMDLQDEMWPVERLCSEKGFSKSFVYHNSARLGGVKRANKLFFSRNNIERMIKEGTI